MFLIKLVFPGNVGSNPIIDSFIYTHDLVCLFFGFYEPAYKPFAQGCYLTATKGKNGERYILANEKCTSIKETTQLAQELFPDLKIKLPMAVPKPILFMIAWFMEIGSKINGKAPLLSTKDIAMFSRLQQNFDITKARIELGFNPKNSIQAVKEAMLYLQKNKKH